MKLQSKRALILTGIKLLHTLVWLFFVVCIVAIPVAAALHRFPLAGLLASLVLIECLVLGMNRGRCPLTNLAARVTENDAVNFDIYLPCWLARRNKEIFGPLFVAGGLYALAQWLICSR